MDYFSRHIFLFPFNWNTHHKNSSNKVGHLLSSKNWKEFHFKFKIDSTRFNTYNEYNYFYESVRDILGLEEKGAFITNQQYECVVLTDDSIFEIILNNGKTYCLKIKDILVNFYDERIGVFSFHLENNLYNEFIDILNINEFGRRLFPPFLSPDNFDLKKHTILAKQITIKNLIANNDIIEDFEYYSNMKNIGESYFNLPAFIQQLLGDSFGNLGGKQAVSILPLLDDRMFVISHLKDKKLINHLKQYDNVINEYQFINDTDWYKYLFIDTDAVTCQSKAMRKELLKQHTYERWIEEGSLYGVSRYSFVLLSSGGPFVDDVVDKHIQYIYFNMVLLCLVQRSYIIHFGNQIAKIAKQIVNKEETIAQYRNQVSTLYLNYLKFINKVYYREVTAQEQGIEIYNMLQDKMKIKEQMENLDKEILELNNFIETTEQSSLSKVANLFLPLSLLTSIFGMNIIPDTFYKNHESTFFVVAAILLSLTIYVLYRQYKNKLKTFFNRILK